MSDVAIRIENLGKMYRIGGKQERYRTFRDSLTDAVSAPFKRARNLLHGQAYGAAGLEEEIWALKNVSFEVKQGEVVGIIGRNGAGKSTLLKVLSRITEPTEGYVDIYGRVGALLEVGTGFHPELTGRENIYLNGAILGMPREEINRKFDDIVDFAGVAKFIDTPVKHYSSGMGLRLGFSVAAHLEPEILIVDEVLAVGDARFQQKCLGKMSDVVAEGRTVLFVSHNMTAVSNLCSRVIWLDEGRVQLDDKNEHVINQYSLSSTAEHNHFSKLGDRTDRSGNGMFHFQSIELKNAQADSPDVRSAMPLDINIEYVMEEPQNTRDIKVAIVFMSVYDERLFTCSLEHRYGNFDVFPAKGKLTCHIPSLPLVPGHYKLYLWASVRGETADRVQNAGSFFVSDFDYFGSGKMPDGRQHGPILVMHDWSIDEAV